MTAGAILLAIVRFACWEAALFLAAIRLAQLAGWRNGRSAVEFWLVVLAIQITLESSIAAAFSFAGINSQRAYWIAAAVCLVAALVGRTPWSARVSPDPPGDWKSDRWIYSSIAALTVPLVLQAFKPVEEIDSINYLHYLIEWLANRATPYTFATNYVAFWELSFAPVWMVTRVDIFFPLLALKSIVLLALALWLVGTHLGVPRSLLLGTIFCSVAMQHFWFGPSGVPTLKNDALHGVGFVLMTLAILRAAKQPLTRTDVALLAFGAAFGAVKYTGSFVAAIAIAVVLFLRRTSLRSVSLLLTALAVAVFFLLTSGHYYLHNLLQYGSPFYPFQINLAFLHLPGTADLSNTSILYSLRDARLWRALFLPAGGLSPAGLLFPVILAATLLLSAGRCALAVVNGVRRRESPSPLDWTAFFLLCGWILYFRSVFSASAYSGDLAFILNGLNSIRYVDGVLAVSELFLVARLSRFVWLTGPLVAVHLISRLMMLYVRIELFSLPLVLGIALLVFAMFMALRSRAIPIAVLCLVMLGPLVVERNRERWTPYWNHLKPALRTVAGKGLSELALQDGGYYAGHMVAVGSPLDTSVRSLLPEEIDALPAGARPLFLVVMVTPGSEAAGTWESRYGPAIERWGYQKLVPGKMGALFGNRETDGTVPHF